MQQGSFVESGGGVAARVKALRLALNLSQEGLARRTGISTGTIKRFEKTGQISIDSLLEIAIVLGYLDEFNRLFSLKPAAPATAVDPIKTARPPQRGRIK